VSDLMLGHPASRLQGRPSAPPPLWVTLAVDGCMFMVVGVLALVNAPWWSFLVPLALGAPILVRYGRREAVAMGICSREETPHGWLLALAIPSGLAGVLAAHTGRYGGLVIMTYIVLAQRSLSSLVRRLVCGFSEGPPLCGLAC
jgi:uncharacterized membrane protein HdeD (DUF308 family)